MSSRSGSALARRTLEEPFFPAVLPAALPSVLPRPPVGPGGRKTPTETTERASENSMLVLPAGLHRGWQQHDATPGAATSGVWGLARLCGRLVQLSGGLASAALTTAVGLVREAQLEGEPTAWITEKHSGFFPPDVRDSGVDLEALVVVRLEALTEGPRAVDMLLRSGGFGLVVVDLGSGCNPGRGPARARGRATRDAGLSWMTTAVQARLAGLAQKHRAALVLITAGPQQPEERRQPLQHRPYSCSLNTSSPGLVSPGSLSLGPLISLRVEASRSGASSSHASRRDASGGSGPSRDASRKSGRPSGSGPCTEEERPRDDPDQDRVEIIVHVLRDKRGGLSRPHREVCRGPDGLR
jgi:hypothetical protein